MTILLTQAVRVGGSILAAGTTQTLDAALEGDLVTRRMATYVSDPATALNGVPVTANVNHLTGMVRFFKDGIIVDNRIAIGSGLLLPVERSPVGAIDVLSLPNPYPAQPNAPVHPALLFFPAGWNGFRYWLAFTPYPGDDSTYENPCVVASNDFEEWFAPAANPLVMKPSGSAYNADTHLFMSADSGTMYLAFRERGVAGQNHLKVMHTTDGKTWTSPAAVLSGAVGSQDFASPSIWWNGTGWTCLSHNLDAAAPWPIQRRVSNSADVYGTWGVPTTVTAAPPSGRAWWHSFFIRTGSAQVIGLLQDNNQTVGASGTLYLMESGDDGATFGAIRQIYKPTGKYRSCFCLETVDDLRQMRVLAGDMVGKYIETFVLREMSLDRANSFGDWARSIIGAAQFQIGGMKWADTFARADNAATVGTADSGGTYTVSTGTWGISGNAAYPVANGRLLADVGVSAYRFGVQFVDMTDSVQQWAIFRGVNGTNYWRVGVDFPTASGPQQLKLQSVVAGAVVLNELIGSIERGQSLFVETSPGGFRIYVDGVLQHERLDGLHGVATQVGIQSNAGATSKYRHLVCEAF